MKMIFNKRRIIKQLSEENIELKDQIKDLIKENNELRFKQNSLEIGNEVQERFIKNYEKSLKDCIKAIEELKKQNEAYYKQLVGINKDE